MTGDRYVPSSPTFFRLIGRAALIAVAVTVLASFLVPAPLQEGADPETVPNPAKAGWFLLWIQEMVSWSTLTVYPLAVLALLFIMLPWLSRPPAPEHASWFPRWNRMQWVAALVVATAVLLLTLVALLLRGENWRLVTPW